MNYDSAALDLRGKFDDGMADSVISNEADVDALGDLYRGIDQIKPKRKPMHTPNTVDEAMGAVKTPAFLEAPMVAAPKNAAVDEDLDVADVELPDDYREVYASEVSRRKTRVAEGASGGVAGSHSAGAVAADAVAVSSPRPQGKPQGQTRIVSPYDIAGQAIYGGVPDGSTAYGEVPGGAEPAASDADAASYSRNSPRYVGKQAAGSAVATEDGRPFKRTTNFNGAKQGGKRTGKVAGQAQMAAAASDAMKGSARALASQGKSASSQAAPRKRMNKGVKALVITLICLLVLAVAAVGVDLYVSHGRIHQGVTVDGVDVGGLTQEQAVQRITDQLSSKVNAASITAVPNAAALQRINATIAAASDGTQSASYNAATDGGVVTATIYNPGASSTLQQADDETATADATLQTTYADGTTVTGNEGANSQTAATDVFAQVATSYTMTADSLGASVDADATAAAAYAVGRSDSLIDKAIGRWNAWFGDTDVTPIVAYDDTVLDAAVQNLTASIGIPMVNYGFTITDGVASLTEGNDGTVVDKDALKEAFATAVETGQTSIEIPMKTDLVDITAADAQNMITQVQAVLDSGDVTFSYAGQSWTVSSATYGNWITGAVTGTGDDATLTASVDPDLAVAGLQAVLGSVSYGTAVNATFDVSSGTPVIVGGTAGTGPDLTAGATALNSVLFGGVADRNVVLSDTAVQPQVTQEVAATYGVTTLLNEYVLQYGDYDTSTTSNREFNIERALNILNGSLVAPGATWDWNEVVGYCSYDNGFKAAHIISDGQYVDSEGGGICNVATAVFNAVYEAGLPVLERYNHSIYQENYPEGRDAAVSWPSLKLVWQNNMSTYVYMTARYDGFNIYIDMWGTPDGRSVVDGGNVWNGNTVTNTRYVYAADGSLWWTDSFVSTFKSGGGGTSTTTDTTDTTDTGTDENAGTGTGDGTTTDTGDGNTGGDGTGGDSTGSGGAGSAEMPGDDATAADATSTEG